MEPNINLNHLELQARGDMQMEFNDLFNKLQSLPHGPENAIEEKEDLYEELLTLITKGHFYPANQREELIAKVEEAFKISAMTKEELSQFNQNMQDKLDKKYTIH